MNKAKNLFNDLSPYCETDVYDSDIGLYIHIPFCVKRCHFCAFYLVMQEERRIERFLGALDIELAFYAVQLNGAEGRVSTVYVGGGTPTALSADQLADVLGKVATRFSLTKDCEVTVEATPESFSIKYLDTLRKAGVTRLSMGIQTFDQQERIRLGLSSTEEEAIAGIRLVKQAGLTNFNLDLIYGIPGQTLSSWERTLRQACECEPTHLSCYALSLEEGTRFDLAFRRGELDLIETDVERQFQAQAITLLDVAGYARYEISNWLKPGQVCRHNRRYWKGQDYVGVGPSAQSYLSGCRFGNVANLDQYCRQLEGGAMPIAVREQLSIIQQEKERVIFGLRLIDGVPLNSVKRIRHDPAWTASLTPLLEEDYLVQTSSRLALTAKGRQFADMVGRQLI
jgi:oxygen-independent coproporphyrinogen-3 oxidase